MRETEEKSNPLLDKKGGGSWSKENQSGKDRHEAGTRERHGTRQAKQGRRRQRSTKKGRGEGHIDSWRSERGRSEVM